MSQVKIYTTNFCPFCVRAKQLFENKGVQFEEINLTGKGEELATLKEQTGMMTVPQIFINDKLVGGYTEVAALDRDGQLDSMLGS